MFGILDKIISAYKFIYNLMTRRTVMMTAHHRDDQAETFVCQLLRGAGAKGLSSMPELKKISLSLI